MRLGWGGEGGRRTVALHVDYNEGSCGGGERGIVRPGVGVCRGDLGLGSAHGGWRFWVGLDELEPVR